VGHKFLSGNPQENAVIFTKFHIIRTTSVDYVQVPPKQLYRLHTNCTLNHNYRFNGWINSTAFPLALLLFHLLQNLTEVLEQVLNNQSAILKAVDRDQHLADAPDGAAPVLDNQALAQPDT